MPEIEFQGTGGGWEGDLNDTNVEINLDDVLNFDGSDDKIDTNLNLNSTNSSGDTSITFWFKADSNKTAADQVIVSGYAGGDGGRWDIYHRDDNDIRFWHHDKGDGAQYMIDTSPTVNGTWYHFAVVHDDSANTTAAYLNGILVQTATGSVTNNLTPNVDLHIGCRPGPELWFDGCIADVKVYDAALDATQVSIAAAKINQLPDVIGAGTPDGWYKLTNNSTSNSGGAGGTPSVTGTSREYDAFSVDVHDNSTATDGQVIVKQGKLECLSLSAMEFNGTNQEIALNGNLTMAGDYTFATWFNADEYDDSVLLGKGSDASMELRFDNSTTFRVNFNNQGTEDITTTDGADGLKTNTWHHFAYTRDISSGLTSVYIDGVFNASASFDASHATGNFDVIAKASSNYFDGHLRDMRFYDGLLATPDQIASLYAGTFLAVPKYWWKFDEGTGLVLSQGTAASLNPGDTGANAANLDGVWSNGTLDLDGKLEIGEAGNNIYGNEKAFLSAPRGDLAVDANVKNYGIYTHNNGTFKPSGDGQTIQDEGNFIRRMTFHNVTIVGSNSITQRGNIAADTGIDVNDGDDLSVTDTVVVVDNNDANRLNAGDYVLFGSASDDSEICRVASIDSTTQITIERALFGTVPAVISNNASIFYVPVTTIEGTLTIPSGATWNNSGATSDKLIATVHGTETAAGTIANSGTLKMGASASGAGIEGRSPLYPVTITGTLPDFDDAAQSSTNDEYTFIGNSTTAVALTTGAGSNAVRLRMSGDTKWGEITVTAGDELDLNGHRLEATKITAWDGALKGTTANSMIVYTGTPSSYNHKAGANSSLTETTIIDHSTLSANINMYYHANCTIKNYFHNHTGGSYYVQPGANDKGIVTNNIIAAPWTAYALGPAATYHLDGTDLTIAEGGTMSAGANVIRQSGDVTTSGGFIGKSGMVLTGNNDYEGMSVTELQAKGDWGFSGNQGVTIEGWFKFDDLDFGTAGQNDAILAGHIRSGDTTGKRYGLGLQIMDDKLIAMAANNDTATTHYNDCSIPVSDLTAGMWHHIAMTVDDANLSSTPLTKLYLDGQLKKQCTGVTATYFSYNFVVGGYADNHDSQNWAGRTMDGAIARVSAFRQEMTAAQIRSMMFTDYTEMAALTSGVMEERCVGWWQFDEGTGTTVDNKGTAGAPPSSDHSNFDGKISTTFQDLTCDLTNNDATVTCDSSALIHRGMSVKSVASVAGFPANAYVKSIGSGTEGTNVTQFELSANFTGTTASNQQLQFTWLGTNEANKLIPAATSWASAGTFTEGTSQLLMTGSSKSINYTGDETIGDLEIDSGQTTLNDITGSGTDTLTAGYVKIESGATLTSTAGTLAVTDESAGGYAFENLGTFNHNVGKILVDYDTPNKNDNTDVKADTFNDFEIKMNGASYSVMPRDLSGSNTVEFLGDLTITQGKLDDNVNSDVYIIHGNTYVEANGSFGSAANWHTGNITHHGVVTLNGGTYYRSNAGGTVSMGGLRNIGGLIL